jgi:hypothetical protein
MLYFDRYAKLLAPELNVFRDPRIVAGLMEDVMQARLRIEPPAPTASRATQPTVEDTGDAGPALGVRQAWGAP